MNIFFDSWESLLRVSVITIVSYLSLIVFLRVSGKRTLSKMNAFDFIVTIALGSSFASVALNKSIALVDGLLVFALLILLQYLLTWLSVRNHKVKHLITNEPTLLWYKGKELNNALKKQRVTREELNVAARRKGITDLKNIDIIVLETTGDITMIPSLDNDDPQTLIEIENFNQQSIGHRK